MRRRWGAGGDAPGPAPPPSRLSACSTRRARWLLGALFAVLLGAFAVGIWGTVVRPPAWEVRGEVVARPAPDMILVRHPAVAALGMEAMETMAVLAEPARLDAAGVRPGDRVRMAVRRRGDEVVLIRIAKLP